VPIRSRATSGEPACALAPDERESLLLMRNLRPVARQWCFAASARTSSGPEGRRTPERMAMKGARQAGQPHLHGIAASSHLPGTGARQAGPSSRSIRIATRFPEGSHEGDQDGVGARGRQADLVSSSEEPHYGSERIRVSRSGIQASSIGAEVGTGKPVPSLSFGELRTVVQGRGPHSWDGRSSWQARGKWCLPRRSSRHYEWKRTTSKLVPLSFAGCPGGTSEEEVRVPRGVERSPRGGRS
jgi:hypothetical protein